MNNALPNVPPPVSMLNTPVHAVTMQQTLDLARQFMEQPGVSQICTTNPEFVIKAQEDEAFRQLLWEAALCIPDGVGLLHAAKWMGTPLPERVPGSELVYRLTERCAQEGWRLFLLGAAPGIAEEAAAIFQEKYPALSIAGTYAGSPALAENDAIVEMINNGRADILYVAYGNPKQDKWIARNREKLTNVRIAVGIGGSLDFVTGKSIRAPRWAQKLGVEWLYRLWREPWRWRRMLALPRFVFAVIFSGTGRNREARRTQSVQSEHSTRSVERDGQ